MRFNEYLSVIEWDVPCRIICKNNASGILIIDFAAYGDRPDWSLIED